MGAGVSDTILVLDSWPVLEWIKNREPASSRFAAVLSTSVNQRVSLEISRINYGEVIYSIRKAQDIPDREASLRVFRSLALRVHSASDALVDEAVELKSKYPFSFADAFAAALAMRLGAPLVTGDPEFRSLEADGLLRLQWIGN